MPAPTRRPPGRAGPGGGRSRRWRSARSTSWAASMPPGSVGLRPVAVRLRARRRGPGHRMGEDLGPDLRPAGVLDRGSAVGLHHRELPVGERRRPAPAPSRSGRSASGMPMTMAPLRTRVGRALGHGDRRGRRWRRWWTWVRARVVEAWSVSDGRRARPVRGGLASMPTWAAGRGGRSAGRRGRVVVTGSRLRASRRVTVARTWPAVVVVAAVRLTGLGAGMGRQRSPPSSTSSRYGGAAPSAAAVTRSGQAKQDRHPGGVGQAGDEGGSYGAAWHGSVTAPAGRLAALEPGAPVQDQAGPDARAGLDGQRRGRGGGEVLGAEHLDLDEAGLAAAAGARRRRGDGATVRTGVRRQIGHRRRGRWQRGGAEPARAPGRWPGTRTGHPPPAGRSGSGCRRGWPG